MAKKAAKNTLKQELMQKDVWVAGSVTLTILALVSGFISASLGIFLAGAFSLGYAAMKEYQRRSSWEGSVDTRIKTISDDVERLDFENMRNMGDIRNIKKGMAQAGKKVRANALGARTSYETLKTLAEDMETIGKSPRTSALSRAQSHQNRLMSIRKHQAANDAQNVYSVDSARNRAIQQTVKRALESKKFKSFTQPIVALDSRQNKFEEVYSRIQFRGEAYMPASRFLDTAKQSGYIADIDISSLSFALSQARIAANRGKLFFINISGTTLKSGRFMSRLLRAITENRALAPFIIFEMQQADFETVDAQTFDILKGVSDLGCGLSIDHVRDLDLSLELVSSLNVRFVKLNAKMLQNAIKTRRGNEQVRELKSALDRNNIDVIVERLESEKDMRDLAGLNFKYGQGYLFSKPTLQSVAAA